MGGRRWGLRVNRVSDFFYKESKIIFFFCGGGRMDGGRGLE